MQGQPQVSHWFEWKCDGELRYVRPNETTTKPDRLQQKWFRNGADSTGAVCITAYEWRDVPVVIPGQSTPAGESK